MMAIFTFRGEVGVLAVSGLRNLVEQARFEGHAVDLWIGRGWFVKPVALRGDPRVLHIILRALEPKPEPR